MSQTILPYNITMIKFILVISIKGKYYQGHTPWKPFIYCLHRLAPETEGRGTSARNGAEETKTFAVCLMKIQNCNDKTPL